MTSACALSGPPTSQSPSPPPGASLIPINLEQPQERSLLYNHREICGWNKDKIEKWRAGIAAGHRTMFWITLPHSSLTTLISDTTSVVDPIIYGDDKEEKKMIYPVGHISLDYVDSPDHIEPDLEVATGDGEIMEITTLFVLPQFNRLHLGTFAMDECERLARVPPFGSEKCRAVTVTTLSSRYLENGIEGPEGKGRWGSGGHGEMPKRDNAVWYRKRGYVGWKEVERYWHGGPDGVMVGWFGLCMRKELGPDVQGKKIT